MARTLDTIVIPAAGQGTRLQRTTRVTAKEMLPVYDAPMLQFAMDEAAATGAKRVVIVISANKLAIRDYLAPRDATTRPQSDPQALQKSGGLEVIFAYQDAPLGLGHAIFCAEPHMLPGPFGVILPDDVIFGVPCLAEMADAYPGGHMVAAMTVPVEETSRYGIFRQFDGTTGSLIAVSGMVEKPELGTAPSRLAAVGRYILDPSIFGTLDQTKIGVGGEMQLTDAINTDARRLPLTAFRFSGRRFDCGNLDGLLEAANARQAQLRRREAYITRLPALNGLRPRPAPQDDQHTRA